MAFSFVNDAKFSSLFHQIGQIYTNLDNLAPVDSMNILFCFVIVALNTKASYKRNFPRENMAQLSINLRGARIKSNVGNNILFQKYRILFSSCYF